MTPTAFTKASLLKYAPAYLIFFFTPILILVGFVVLLVLLDVITGIKAASRRGEIISSRKMSTTVNKVVFYFIAIMSGRVMELLFTSISAVSEMQEPFIPIAQIVAGYIGLVEFKSNIENIESITGIDLWKKITDRLTSFRFDKKDAG